jgi:hypothetical protein
MTEICLERMEPAPVEMANIAVHHVDSNREEHKETVGATDDQSGDWHLAIGRHRQPKKWTQGKGGFQQKLAAARGQLTRSSVSASRKGHGCQGPGRDRVARRAPKGWTLKKRCQARPKRNKGIRDLGLRRELHLGSKETFYEALGQIIGLEVTKQAVEFSFGLQKMSVKTLWRSWPPPK